MGLEKVPAGAILLDVSPKQDKAKDVIPGQYYASHASMLTSLGGSTIVHAYPNHGVHEDNLVDDGEEHTDSAVSKDSQLFSVLTIHHKNPRVQQAMGEFSISNWSAFTPFTYNMKGERASTKEDYHAAKEARRDAMDVDVEPRHDELVALFRGVRNALRIMSRTPVSKKKGVSCSNFVSYIIQAAIIKALFPNGIPESIRGTLHNIQQAHKKAGDVPMEDLLEFEKVFLKAVQEHGQNLGADHQEIMQELYRSVKTENANDLYAHALEHPNTWDVKVMVLDGYSASHVPVPVAQKMQEQGVRKLSVTHDQVARAEAQVITPRLPQSNPK